MGEFETSGKGKFTKSAPALASDDTAYVGSKDHKLYAISHDGHLKWTRLFSKHVKSRPAIHPDGSVILGITDKNSTMLQDGKKHKKVHKVVALNPEDGTTKWEFVVDGKVTKSWPAVDVNGTVYF